MAYATTTDLARFGLPLSVLNDIATLDAGAADAALQAASDIADGYLRSQYDLPLQAPFPHDLVAAVCKLAAYELVAATRGYNPESDPSVRDRAKDATRWLEQVGQGVITPAIVDSSGVDSPAAPVVLSNCRRGW